MGQGREPVKSTLPFPQDKQPREQLSICGLAKGGESALVKHGVSRLKLYINSILTHRSLPALSFGSTVETMQVEGNSSNSFHLHSCVVFH
jgi:hypothetical protein